MPELPEVESARRTVEKFMLNSSVTSVNLLEQGGGPRSGQFDDIICQSPESEILAFLKGRHISSCHRRGKQLYFAVSSSAVTASASAATAKRGKAGKSSSDGLNVDYGVVEGYLCMHFGMTGAFIVKDAVVPQYKSVKIDQHNFPPRFCKLHITFENGRELAFSDPRRLGRIRLLIGRDLDPLTHPPLSNLARDPLLDGVPADYLQKKLQASSMPIKALFLDQEKVLAGIGNYLIDEILYQCQVHPRSISSAIPPDVVANIAAATERIIKVACQCNEDDVDFPRDWLFHYRWGKGKTDESPKKQTGPASEVPLNRMPDGGVISFDTVGGRTSAVVEAVQVKYMGGNKSSVKVAKTKESAKGKESGKDVGKAKGQGKAKEVGEPVEAVNELKVEEVKKKAPAAKRKAAAPATPEDAVASSKKRKSSR